eukprot:CFRG6989T1
MHTHEINIYEYTPISAMTQSEKADKFDKVVRRHEETGGWGFLPSGSQTVDTSLPSKPHDMTTPFGDRAGAMMDKPTHELTSEEIFEEVMENESAPSLLRLSFGWKDDDILEVGVMEAIITRTSAGTDKAKDIHEEDAQHAEAIGRKSRVPFSESMASMTVEAEADLAEQRALADEMGQWWVEVSMMNAETMAEVKQTSQVQAEAYYNTAQSSTTARRVYKTSWYETVEHDVQKPIVIEQEALRRRERDELRSRLRKERRTSITTNSGNESSDGGNRRKSSLLRTMGWMRGQGMHASSSIANLAKLAGAKRSSAIASISDNGEKSLTSSDERQVVPSSGGVNLDTNSNTNAVVSNGGNDKEKRNSIVNDSVVDEGSLHERVNAEDVYRKYNVVIILYRDEEAVGEISLPLSSLLRTTLPVMTWIELSEIDRSFKARLQRVGAIASQHGKKRKILNRFQQDWEDPSVYLRKLISLETLFIVITLCQILFATLIVTVILYRYAYSELTHSAEMVSREVTSSIIDELSILMEAVQVQVVISSSALQMLIENKSWNMAASLLQVNFESQRTSLNDSTNDYVDGSASQNVSQLLYFGTNTSEFISAGYANMTHDTNITTTDFSTNQSLVGLPMINYALSDMNGPDNLTMVGYGINNSCPAYDFLCPVANMSDVLRVRYPFNATSRDWYIEASNSEDTRPVWTNTYQYAGSGGLGITAAFRFPRNISRPTEYVTAADVALKGLDARLSDLDYYVSGFGYIWEKATYLLVASSVRAPIRDANGRIPINQSADVSIRDSGEFITNLCTVNGYSCINPEIIYHHQDMLISMDNFTSVGLEWVVTVVIPSQDFLGFYNTMLVVCVIVALADTILTVLLTVLVVSSITGKLTQATKQLSNFSRLDFASEVPDTQSFVKEICRIYEALVAMRLSLRSFSKYVPPSVVKILVDQGKEARLGGQRRVISIFFSDIAGFSQLSETVDLDQLLPLLGTYLQEMSVLIQDNEGIIDKFIGDHIMALWNAPATVNDHAYKACETALLSQARLSSLRWEWEVVGCPYLQSRIGIHTGDAIVGNFGSADRLNYTALGDSVNLASRLQGLNDVYGTDIIISAETQALVGESFLCRPLDVVAVKGRQQPICVYELVTHKEAATFEQLAGVQLFSDAFARYQAHDVDAAADLFNRYLKEVNSTDKAANMHLKTCIHAPDGDWKGFRVMTTK